MKLNKGQLKKLIQESVWSSIGDAAKSALGFGAKEKTAPIAQPVRKPLNEYNPFFAMPEAEKEEIKQLIQAAYYPSFVRINYRIDTEAMNRGGNMVYSQDEEGGFAISIGSGTPAADKLEYSNRKSYSTGQQEGRRNSYTIALGVLDILKMPRGYRERLLYNHYDKKVVPMIENFLQKKGYDISNTNLLNKLHKKIKLHVVPRSYNFSKTLKNAKIKISGSARPGPGEKVGWVTGAYTYDEVKDDLLKFINSGYHFFQEE